MSAGPRGVPVPASLQLAVRLALAFALMTVPCASRSSGQLRVLPRIEAYGNCPMSQSEKEKVSHFIESSVVPYGRTYVGKGVMNVTRDIRKFTQTVVYITKCSERNDPNCELWQQWRFGENVCCYNLQLRNMMWTPLFRADPTFDCPMSKGLYRQENVTMDVDRMIMAGFNEALQKSYFKIRMEIDADRTRIMNSCMELSTIRVRT